MQRQKTAECNAMLDVAAGEGGAHAWGGGGRGGRVGPFGAGGHSRLWAFHVHFSGPFMSTSLGPSVHISGPFGGHCAFRLR